MKISGLVSFTATDYPDHLAAVLFCQGCPWRCRYCHNPHLQLFEEGKLKWSQILYFLHARRKLLDAVVFSGGEPLSQPLLQETMAEVKSLGFKIGLHTGGASPERLKSVLPLIDWIGFDIKAPFTAYERITNVLGSGKMAEKSFHLVIQSGVDFQLRTTVHPHLLSADDLDEIKQEIQSALGKSATDPLPWVLQPFRATGCQDQELITLS